MVEHFLLVSKNNLWSLKLFDELTEKLGESKKLFLIHDKDQLLDFAYRYKTRCDIKAIFFFHWSEYIPAKVYKNNKCISIHTSNLPDGQGGTPLQNQILDGITQTRVNALETTSKIDAGPIYCSEPITLQGSLTDIWMTTAEAAKKCILKIIDYDLEPINEQNITKNGIIYKRIKGSTNPFETSETLRQVYDKIRMLDAAGYPEASCKVGDFVLKFNRAKLQQSSILCDVIIERVE